MNTASVLMAALAAGAMSFASQSFAQTMHYPGGKATFDGKCAVCHQAGGKGMDGLAPPLVDYPGKYAGSPEGIRLRLRTVAVFFVAADVDEEDFTPLSDDAANSVRK